MNKLVLILAVITLAGCASQAPKIEVRENLVPISCDMTARPDPVNLVDTPPTLVMNEAGVWGYWFTADLYATLAENIHELRRWIAQAIAIRNKLSSCIETHNAKAEAAPPDK